MRWIKFCVSGRRTCDPSPSIYICNFAHTKSNVICGLFQSSRVCASFCCRWSNTIRFRTMQDTMTSISFCFSSYLEMTNRENRFVPTMMIYLCLLCCELGNHATLCVCLFEYIHCIIPKSLAHSGVHARRFLVSSRNLTYWHCSL